MVLLVCARDRRARAEAAVRHHDRGAARERSERRLLARSRPVDRPGAQDDGAGDDVVDAADERRRERPLLRADPGDPRDAALSSATTRPATTPPRRAASSSRKTSPARFGRRRRLLGRADDRVVADRVCAQRPAPHAPCGAASRGDDDERVAGDLRERPVLDHRAGHLNRERPDDADVQAFARRRRRRGGGRGRRRRPLAVTAASQRAGEHEQSRRRPHPATKAERGEPCGPPRP